MVYFLFVLMTLFGALPSIFMKMYFKSEEDNDIKKSVYYVIMIVVALILFAILAGFNLSVNLVNCIFACIFAILSYLSTSFNIKAVENTDVVK